MLQAELIQEALLPPAMLAAHDHAASDQKKELLMRRFGLRGKEVGRVWSGPIGLLIEKIGFAPRNNFKFEEILVSGDRFPIPKCLIRPVG